MKSVKPSGPGQAARRQQQMTRRIAGGEEPIGAVDAVTPALTPNEDAPADRHQLRRILNEAELAVFNKSASEAAAALRAQTGFGPLPRGHKHMAWGVTLAYSRAKAVQEHPESQDLIAELATMVGLKRRKDTDAATVAVRMVFDYGSTQAERNANRQFAGIHADAVRHLLGLGLTDEQVFELVSERSTGPSVLANLYRESIRPPSKRKRRLAAPTVAKPVGLVGNPVSDLARSYISNFKSAGFDQDTKVFITAVRRDGEAFQIVAMAPVADSSVADARLKQAITDLGATLRNAGQRVRYR